MDIKQDSIFTNMFALLFGCITYPTGVCFDCMIYPASVIIYGPLILMILHSPIPTFEIVPKALQFVNEWHKLCLVVQSLGISATIVKL